MSFYLLIDHTTHQTFNNRLKDIRAKIKTDIEKEFERADKQLKQYNAIYHSKAFSFESKKALLYQQASNNKEVVQQLFSEAEYKNAKRLFWVDVDGNTLAKWNPFGFEAPFLNVSKLDYFKMLKEKWPDPGSKRNEDIPVIYAGKSIVTGEFLLYIARPDNDSILINAKCDVCKDSSTAMYRKSYAVVMPFYLNCSVSPVLPAEFGFCLVDDNGRVLVHSDDTKNLSENIISETGENKRLQNCIRYKNEELISNVNLYGQPTVFGVTPIKDQPLTLVVFYNKNLLFNNTLRLLHFSVESLAYLYLVLITCLLLSTGFASRPTKLRFKRKMDWIRPSHENADSYEFTRWYFVLLCLLVFIFFSIVLIGDFDLRAVFSISLMLPLYTLWGFIASRKRRRRILDTNNFTLKNTLSWVSNSHFLSLIKTSLTTVSFILLFNVIFFVFFNKYSWSPVSDHFNALVFIFLKNYPGLSDNACIIYGFQLTGTVILFVLYSMKNVKPGNVSSMPKETRDNYLFSLYLGIVLIAIMPATGIVLYGYQAEKVQFKKNKQMHLAQAYQKRQDKIFKEFISEYTPVVRQGLVNQHYIDSLKFFTGIYLSDSDSIHTVPIGEKPARSSSELCDEPYSSMMDNVFLISALEFKNYSIKDTAQDKSWVYNGAEDTSGRSITFFYKNKPVDPSLAQTKIRVTSAINTPFHNLINLKFLLQLFILLCIILFIIFGRMLIVATMKRLFLLHYISSSDFIKIDIEFLGKYTKNLNTKQKSYSSNLFRPEKNLSYMKEEYVLEVVEHFKGIFQQIWSELSRAERYFVYDFAKDGYANYKDSDTLYALIRKGVIVHRDDRFELFNPAFRHFLLLKKGTREIRRLKEENAIPGLWETIRIPVLVIIAVFAIFMFITQQDFSHQLTAILTSIAALFPLVMKLFDRVGSPAPAK